MDKRKALVRGAVVAAIVVVIVGMFFIKKGTAKEDVSVAESVLPVATDSLIYGPLELTGPFDLVAYRSSGLPTIIDFGADSCAPCKEMAPVLEELYRELQGKAIIRFIDVWKYGDIAQGYPLKVIPTQMFFDATGKPFTPTESVQLPFNQFMTRDTNEHVFTTHEGGLTKEELLSVLYEMGMKK